MAFPTTSILDDFNRSNATPPSGSWSLASGVASGNIKLASNVISCPDAASVDMSYWNPGTFGPDCEGYITIVSKAAAGDYASLTLDARIQTPTTAGYDSYELEVVMREGGSNVAIVRIWKYVNASFSQLGADISTTINNGDTFGVEITGSSTTTITAYRKPSGGAWGSIGSRTDSTSPITAAGYIALGGYNNTADTFTADDFGGGTVSAAAAVVKPVRRDLNQADFRASNY